MTNIAAIGFEADTSGLDKASNSMDKMSKSASNAESASARLERKINTTTNVYLNNARATLQSVNAKLREAKAAKTVDMTLVSELTTRKRALTVQYENIKATKASERARLSELRAIERMNNTINKGGRRRGPANSNNFNTGNIAAQFQDVGVTAAMGMNPLQIALQQGTQLSAVLNTMDKPLKGIADGFRSITNVVSITTIGLIAIGAALLQMVNWATVGKATLNFLADAIEAVGPAALYTAGTLALIYSKSIVVGIASTTKSIALLGATALKTGAMMLKGWLLGLGPIGLIIAGVSAVSAAFIIFRDEVAKILGFDIVASAKKGMNLVIAVIVSAYEGVKKTWKMLPSLIGEAFVNMFNQTISYFEDRMNILRKMINIFLDVIPGATKLEMVSISRIENPFAGTGAKVDGIFADEFKKAAGKDFVGAISNGVVKAFSGAADKTRGLADSIGTGDDDDKKTGSKKTFEDVISGSDRTIAKLKAQMNSVGLTAEATARLKYETQLLNKAQEYGINLTPEQVTQLKNAADQMAGLEEKTRRTKDALNVSKSAARGFLGDLHNGLKQGQSAFEIFQNTALNVIDKISNRIYDQLVTALFDVNKASGGGGTGGFLGGIVSFFGGDIGAKASPVSGAVPFKPTGFAKGGTFTNSIVSQRTPFTFANGGAFGEMGEAGPEAIMPLSRGSDGKLGVHMYGGKSSSGDKPIVNVSVEVNGANAKVTEEREEFDGVQMRKFIIDVVNEGTSSGELDSSNKGRFNLQPKKVIS